MLWVNSDRTGDDHFTDVSKMVTLGKDYKKNN